MHEYSVVRSLLARIEHEAASRGAVSVHHVKLRVGELSGVEVPLLKTAFVMARERTVAAEADLEVVAVAARWRCPECENELQRGAVLRCPICSIPARLIEGADLLLESLELEVP